MGNMIFKGIINNLIPGKGTYNIIGNDDIKFKLEEFIEKEDYILIKRKEYIFEHILSSEMKLTILNDELILIEGIKIDETGLYKRGKFFEYSIKGELRILEITEEGLKGIIKLDSDVEKYEGESLNGILHGKGKFKTDYFLYEGEFKNGIEDGYGVYYYKNGDIYKGDFKNSKPNGRGIFYFNSGNIAGDRYEGEMKNFYRNGKGLYFYKNGDVYDGDIKLDKFEGKGIYYYANGDREMGNYKNNKKFGKHVKLTAKGEVSSQIYK
jgi:hypothetical protein